jgi:hypothetical protein
LIIVRFILIQIFKFCSMYILDPAGSAAIGKFRLSCRCNFWVWKRRRFRITNNVLPRP